MPRSIPCSLASSFIVFDLEGMSSQTYLTTARARDKMGGMSRKPVPSKVLLALIVAGLVLPMTICVVLALAELLPAMGDKVGGTVLRYVALAGGIVWIVVLVVLILLQAIQAMDRADDADQ